MLNILGAHVDVHNGVETGDRGGEKGLEALGIFLENPKSLAGTEELLLKP